jgi:hypothetical protein
MAIKKLTACCQIHLSLLLAILVCYSLSPVECHRPICLDIAVANGYGPAPMYKINISEMNISMILFHVCQKHETFLFYHQ